jgi:hypothetical protein
MMDARADEAGAAYGRTGPASGKLGREATLVGRLESAAATSVLVLPLALLHSRAVAEILIGAVDVLFLLRCALARDWAWLRRPWLVAALPFSIWTVLCAVVGLTGERGVVQALASLRFLLLATALGEWVLTGADKRRWLGWVMTACAAWIMLESWQQYLLGTNIFGAPRFGDGALTGPFMGPRAGPAFILVFFPALLPPALALLERRSWAARVAGALLIVLGLVTMVLIGQRMPTLLAVLGLVVTAFLVKQLRPVVLAAFVTGAVLLAATPVISPATFQKLVLHFSEQMAHFAPSHYGVIYMRAAVMIGAHPLLGLGWDGFRAACNDPHYLHVPWWLGVPDAVGASPDGCNIHPHNYYLQVAIAAGLPGLVLFCVAVFTWLRLLAQGLGRQAPAIRIALFVGALIALWPFASTSDFFSVPNVGWVFLTLGWGFAERRAAGF